MTIEWANEIEQIKLLIDESGLNVELQKIPCGKESNIGCYSCHVGCASCACMVRG